jgi:hypothetical protein
MLGDLSDHTQYRNNKEWHSSPAQNTTAVVWDVQETNSNDSGSDSSSSSGGGSIVIVVLVVVVVVVVV